METKYLTKLEFDKIRSQLAAYAYSDLAKQTALSLEPSASIFEIDRWLDETGEAFRYLTVKGAPSFNGLTDIRDSVSRSSKGAALTMHEFLVIAAYLDVISRLKDYGEREGELTGDFPNLDPMFQGLMPQMRLEKEIYRCILDDDDMADDASQELHRIRRQIFINESQIQSQLQNMIHSEALKSSLQDAIVTVRQGRYCLPVRSEFRGNIRGMVHDQSSSGTTLFIEPAAVVERNNEIAKLRVDEQMEIARILRSLGKMVNGAAEEILASFKILTDLDFIFAKAKLAAQENAVRPMVSEERKIEINGARHPLLDPHKVVPIDLRLGDGFTSLIITGPNTGGKTVSLKTLGLLQVMGQSGLFIPSKENPRLTVLDQVFADIGDEQSIEQSLSTFSSHMVTIVDILGKMTERSLVLFDELGAGTDPTEGAALAQSILENLHQRKILTAATTHYSELKVYAISTEGVENACCEFDVKTLMPTYRLLIGMPGKSNAFAISRRLGLPESIIHDASELLETNDVKFEDMISDLEARRIEVEKEQAEIDRLKREMARLRSEAAEEKKRTEEEKDSIILKAKKEAKEYLRKAKLDADQTINRVNKLAKSGGVDMAALEKERARLREKAQKITIEQEDGQRTDLIEARPEDLIPGTHIMLKGFDQEYSVLSKPDARGRLQVQAGIIKMQVKMDDIVGIVPEVKQKEFKPKKAPEKQSSLGTSQTIHLEVDLRGMMTDEGVAVLDKYLDDAYLSGVDEVRVIHGKGTGAMRTAVQSYLRHSPHVKSFRLGVYGEGDSGVTIVTMKRR